MAPATADEFSPSLRAAFDAPEALPSAETWLAAPRDEAAQAQYMEHYWRDREDARRRADEGYY